MQVSVKKIGSSFRVVDADTKKLVRGSQGPPVDGGGHKSKAKAVRQTGYINEALSKKDDK